MWKPGSADPPPKPTGTLSSMRIAAATPSESAFDAVTEIAAAGGGAVDAAVAAAAVAMVTEVGVCSPGAGGFLLVADGEEVSAYDGYVAVPGLGDDDGPRPQSIEVTMAYGGGVTTVVGPASIATPGIWAGMEAAHTRHGRLEWSRLLAPAVRLAREGFSFGEASMTYLRHSHHLVYGHDPASQAAIHHADGTLRHPGEQIVMPDLADSLLEIGREGASAIHHGRLARRIAEDLRRRGGRVTATDLDRYRPKIRTPLHHRWGGWDVATNPAPAVGGEALVFLLEELLDGSRSVADHVAAQRLLFERRRSGDPIRAGSTIQVSTVDESGVACALTASSGYGSGVIPEGTGIFMNNALGELELVPVLAALEPGDRLVSNMAPTVCRREDGTVLSIGSPGADRITTALAQVLLSVLADEMPIVEAVTRPRLHVDVGSDVRLAFEPGIDTSGIDLDAVAFDRPHMYFGGVGAAFRSASGDLTAVADPRRDGMAGVTA